jgi:hypothetical protein
VSFVFFGFLWYPWRGFDFRATMPSRMISVACFMFGTAWRRTLLGHCFFSSICRGWTGISVSVSNIDILFFRNAKRSEAWEGGCWEYPSIVCTLRYHHLFYLFLFIILLVDGWTFFPFFFSCSSDFFLCTFHRCVFFHFFMVFVLVSRRYYYWTCNNPTHITPTKTLQL